MRKRIREHKIPIAGMVLAILVAIFWVSAYAQENQEQAPPPANSEAQPAQEQPSEEDSNSSTADQPADNTQSFDGSGESAGGEAKPADEAPQDPPSAESTNTEPNPEPGVDAALEGLGDVLGETLKTLKEVQSTLQDAPSGTPAGSNAVSETGSSDQPSLLDTLKNLDRLKKKVRRELEIQSSIMDAVTLRDVNDAISKAEIELRRKPTQSVNVTLNRKAEELRLLTQELKQLNDLLGAQEAPAEGANK